MKNMIITLGLVFVSLAFPFSISSKENKEQTIYILLGPPGSGKGTQAIRLAKALNLPHISTGDLFRENLQNQTELGKKAKTYMDAGKLVPDEIVLEMLKKRLSQQDTEKGYILDGFPRTLTQAQEFEKQLGTPHKITVINLEVRDEEIVNRITKRAKESSKARADDTPEIAKKRLTVYHAETKPLIDYYQKKKQLIKIDGEKTPDAVFQEILDKIKPNQTKHANHTNHTNHKNHQKISATCSPLHKS